MNIEHTAHATLSHSAPRAQNKNRRSIIDVWVYRHARGTRLARSSHDRHVRVRSTRPAHIAESSQHMPHCTLGSPARSPDPTARTRAILQHRGAVLVAALEVVAEDDHVDVGDTRVARLARHKIAT